MNPRLIMQVEFLTQGQLGFCTLGGNFMSLVLYFSFAGLAIFSIVWLESSKKFLRIKLELFTF